MTVLILGGAGYIGSHATDEFLARGYDVALLTICQLDIVQQ